MKQIIIVIAYIVTVFKTENFMELQSSSICLEDRCWLSSAVQLQPVSLNYGENMLLFLKPNNMK